MNRMRLKMRKRRKELNLTQDEVAKLAGKSRSWYTKIETGKHGLKLDDMIRIAKALKVDFDGDFFADYCEDNSQEGSRNDDHPKAG